MKRFDIEGLLVRVDQIGGGWFYREEAINIILALREAYAMLDELIREPEE